MKNCLFYGSLRAIGDYGKPFYNFDRFGKGTQKYIKTAELDGYDLYDLGAYPGLTKGTGKVTVELHEVDDNAFKHIQNMEAGAGYVEGKETIDGIEASIFFYEGDLKQYPKIENGNWTGRSKKRGSF